MISGALCATAGANDAIRLVVPRHGLLQHSTDVLRPVRWVQPARCEIFRHRCRLSEPVNDIETATVGIYRASRGVVGAAGGLIHRFLEQECSKSL